MLRRRRDFHQDYLSNSPSSRILTDGIFTFFIGDEKKRFDVHIAALKRISEPFGVLMSNGKMMESITKEATLEEVDPVTFGLLVEFAYKGFCGISHDGVLPVTVKAFVPLEFHCHYCSAQTCTKPEETNHYPYCSRLCDSDHKAYLQNPTAVRKRRPRVQTFCVAGGDQCESPQDLFCWGCTGSGRATHFPTREASSSQHKDPNLKCSTTFCGMKFDCNTMNHEEISDHIRRHLPESQPMEHADVPLLRYAKLYVLATQYMVSDLPQICLHKLHTQLLTHDINNDSINELIKLILYTYQNTSDDGSIMNGTGDKLRDLVIQYVVDRAKDVMKYETFRREGLLGADGAPVDDFMAIMYGAPTA